jgi:hypothetical protein
MYYFCNMIELSKHIEVLLLENDCVIVPGLGGFIAHKRQAAYSIQKGEFMPPLRTIGFNPQLIMNDGLLVQSYMQAFNTDFPDATRRIEKTVAEIKDQLYQQGQVTLHNVGTIYYNMNGGTGSRIFLHSKSIRAGKFHASAAADIACVFSEAVDSGNT